jgi:hypothetical protein
MCIENEDTTKTRYHAFHVNEQRVAG